ncbi:MAG: hypothetical protein QG549_44 [Patescibacteria group bacterium]|nr:hypothetical protein [Patescibacteria group bacterium]
MVKKSVAGQVTYSERMNARRSLMEELFNDYYDDRRNVYKMNFIRGIFFGFGTVIGGTIVVAVIVWGLSFFVDIPGIGDTAQQVQKSLESGQKK